MRASQIFGGATLLGAASAASPRYVMYYDQWHTTTPPTRDMTAGVTHVITAFAQSTTFNWAGQYTPFAPLESVRALFDNGVKVCMAIGGWGDNAGFSTALATPESRKLFADNVASELERLGYDCVDIDYEYPGGNGEDHMQVPNEDRKSEIETFPLLLKAIKEAIGEKELSIAAPGRLEDLIAYTPEQVPKIDETVDFVNVMTYDLMNRRDSQTAHHTSVKGSMSIIDTYIERGMTPSKMNLGFAFYAKWFTTVERCSQPVGCKTALLEDSSGADTKLSGPVTFEIANYDSKREEPDLVAFRSAMENGIKDEELGGQWYWHEASSTFWTWDTPEFIQQKFDQIVSGRGLGGVFAWSLAQDSHGWNHLKALSAGVQSM